MKANNTMKANPHEKIRNHFRNMDSEIIILPDLYQMVEFLSLTLQKMSQS